MIIVGSLSHDDNDADAKVYLCMRAWVCNLLAFIIFFSSK